MPPTASRDFQRVAAQRLDAAESLFRLKYNTEAQYLAVYVVECSLKALILELTPVTDRAAMLARMTSGAQWHRPGRLLEVVSLLGVDPPPHVLKGFRRFQWTVDLRYETGRRDTGETAAILRKAKAVHEWVESLLP